MSAQEFTLRLQYPPLTVKVLRQVAEFIREHHGCSVEDSLMADDIADQIEAQTKPPKPAEPTGLGAVVEDAEGVRWVRKGSTTHGEDWTRQIGDAWTGNPWNRIDVVRVLSEGVTA